MADLDRKLFACHREGPYSETGWQEILRHVVGKLEEFLEQPVAVDDMVVYPNGFAGDISSPRPFAGPLRLSWFGRIGVTIVGHREETVLDARLFLRGCGKRLVARDGHALLYLHYGEQALGRFGWSPLEWDQDVYGEFEHWE